MNLGKQNPDVWNSIAFIGERQDFFLVAKSLIAGAIKVAELKTEEGKNLKKNLENSKIYVLGTVGGIVIQRIIFVWKDSKTYNLLEKNSQTALTEEELDELLKERHDKNSKGGAGRLTL